MPADAINQSHIITRAVWKALDEELTVVKEEYIKNAVEEYERKLRKSIANVAMSVHDYYSIERSSTDIVIKVRIEKSE